MLKEVNSLKSAVQQNNIEVNNRLAKVEKQVDANYDNLKLCLDRNAIATGVRITNNETETRNNYTELVTKQNDQYESLKTLINHDSIAAAKERNDQQAVLDNLISRMDANEQEIKKKQQPPAPQPVPPLAVPPVNASDAQSQNKSPRYLNVRVDGLTEKTTENEEYELALKLLRALSIKCEEGDLSLVTRLDLRKYQTGPRTMLICFTGIRMRRAVLQAKWSMKRLPGWEDVYVNPDEDPETRKRNYKLRLIVNYCRSKQFEAIVKKDNLLVENVVYPDLDNLPPSYTPPQGYKFIKLPARTAAAATSTPVFAQSSRGGAQSDTDKSKDNRWTDNNPWRTKPSQPKVLQQETRSGITFTGESSVFSAIYPQQITFENAKYASSEHLYQHLKCVHNNAPTSLKDKIANAPNGFAAFKEGEKIQVLTSWRKEEIPTMKRVQTLKFTLNDDNKKELLATFPQDLIFACPEFFWGAGEPYGDECYSKGGHYTGRNNLGVILMEIRDDIRHGIL